MDSEDLKAKIAAFLQTHESTITIIVVVISVLIIAAVCMSCKHEPQTVTTETQQEVQTESGIEQAADAADVPIDRQQAQSAAKQIQYIIKHDSKQEYTITTDGANRQSQSKAAQERSGADFAVVTPKDETTDISTIDKKATVELNQYNVKAYPKVIRTISVSPDIDSGGRGISTAEVAVSRQIGKTGKYVGAGVDYNVDNHRTYLKLSYSW